LRASNSAFCQDHYFEAFERKVFKAIKSFSMFQPGDRILVAVSGGKDSIALLHLLHHHNYDVTGYYIDLGIESYSEMSTEKVLEFSSTASIPIRIDRVRDLFGVGIDEVARILRRPPCAVCGTVKRYLMNRAAQDFDVVTTGHNLDDEAATLLGNLLHWQEGYIRRQSPSLGEQGTLARKVKPLIYLTEYETAHYAFMKGLDTVVEECPHSERATSLSYKEALNGLEAAMPGTKLSFVKGFLALKGSLFPPEEPEAIDLTPCNQCGSMTTVGLCSVCRMREKVSAVVSPPEPL